MEMPKICNSDRAKVIKWLGEEALLLDKETLLDKLTIYLMTQDCFDADWEIKDFGREIERVMDNIYYEDVDLDS